MPEFAVGAGVKGISVEAVVIKKDGTRIDHGVVAEYTPEQIEELEQKNPGLWQQIKDAWSEAKRQAEAEAQAKAEKKEKE